MNDSFLLQQIALSIIPGLGPKRTREILQLFEHPMEVFRAPLKDFQSLGFFSNQYYQAIHSRDIMQQAESILKKCLKSNIEITFFTHPNYPHRLQQCDDAPVILYTKGNALKSYPFMIAIVGSRMPTAYGLGFVRDFISSIKDFPLCIVSGLAYGIDQTAHQSALEYNIPTVGCVAHGLHTIYPAAHKSLASQMEKCGGIISEYPPGVFADKDRFPMRNRMIAGLTDATIVVESALSGGSLITAQFAQQYNRDIYALPGQIHDEKSAGCHQLIKKNIAAIIQDIPSFMEDLGMKTQTALVFDTPETSTEGNVIIQILTQHRNLHTDELQIRSGLSVSDFAGALFELEINGRIRKLPGCRVTFTR